MVFSYFNKEVLVFFFAKVKTWIALSRPLFQIVGILPFIVGSLIPLRTAQAFDAPVFLWGLLVVVLIMVSTYFNGEIYDVDEDRITVNLEKNSFSGGTQVLVDGLVSSNEVNRVSYFFIMISLFLASILQFYYRTGFWTIPLIATGIMAGFYYSKPPCRWVKRGLGELFIGYSYGWLAVAVGAYLQKGQLDPLVHWVSLPIICSVFNVIVINEYPDYPADIQVNKKNLVVRFGKEKCALIYTAVAAIAIVTFLISLTKGIPKGVFLFYFPVFICSWVAMRMMLMKKFNDRRSLEKMCLITYLVNIGTSLSYILGFLIFR